MIGSNVIGNSLDNIALGPTVPHSTIFWNVYNILKRYNLWEKILDKVKNLLNNGILGKIPETP